MQITTSWHEKGKKEGKKEGKIEKAREDICKFMARKFNADAEEVTEKVQQITSLEILDSLMEELFTANTLEEAQAIIDHGIVRALQ